MLNLKTTFIKLVITDDVFELVVKEQIDMQSSENWRTLLENQG